ncbi:hypothetical protein D3C80_2111330 [compost metagenome]
MHIFNPDALFAAVSDAHEFRRLQEHGPDLGQLLPGNTDTIVTDFEDHMIRLRIKMTR